MQTLCDWIEHMIDKNEEYYIPLNKLWYGYRILFPQKEISLEDFEKTLKSDKRFVFIDKQSSSIQPFSEEKGLLNFDNDEMLESLGIFEGISVGLKSQQPSSEEVSQNIDKYFHKLMNALENMWEARNPNNKEQELAIKKVMDKAELLYNAFKKSHNKARLQ
ncbi:MAG: hypothetical protein ABIH42_10715 [Planctomycetota bacterium]